MSDIADKIYTATGLTLNAEAAAKIGRLIQAENEKLRAENAKLAASNHAYLSDYQEARDEIEKLRAALQTARRDAREEAASLVDDVRQWDGRDEYCESCKGGAVYPDARDVAATIRALGEKE